MLVRRSKARRTVDPSITGQCEKGRILAIVKLKDNSSMLSLCEPIEYVAGDAFEEVEHFAAFTLALRIRRVGNL